METLNSCPVCENNVMIHYLTTKDHFLTNEAFTIVSCKNCGFRFLNPRPGKEEISRYYNSEEYISHDAEKKSFFSTLYKIVRSMTIKTKYQILRKYSEGQNLLDIGCGTGEFLLYCKKMGMNVAGVEPNDKARNFAFVTNGISVYKEEDLDKMEPAFFDVITLWHVLEHVHDLNQRLLKMRELLNPSGIVVIAVPNSGSWDAKHYQGAWAAYDLPRHLYHFTSETIRILAEKYGFSVKNIIPLKWDAFYISLLSEKYKTGSSKLARAILNGFRSNIFASRHKKNYSSLVFILEGPKNEI